MKNLYLLILLFSLAACSPEKPQNDISQTETEETQAVTLMIWEYMDPSMDDAFDEILYGFTQKHPSIEILREHFEPSQLRDAFIQEALTGGGPQLAILPSDHLGTISLSGIVTPIDEIFPKSFQDKFSPQALNHTVLNGKSWGVPLLLGNTVILFYNTEMISAPPQTWEELMVQARKHTSETSWGLTYNLASSFFFAPFYTAFGGKLFESNSSIPSLNNQAMTQALEFVHDLKYKHKILTPKTDSPSANRFFASGQAAFLINGPWAINNFVDKVPFALTPLPTIGGRIPSPLTSSGTLIFNHNLSSKPAELKAAKDLTEYFTSPDVQVQLSLAAREMPAIKGLQNDPRLLEDPYVKQFLKQIQVGTPMPSIPEMRFVFQAIRTTLEEVVFGNDDYAGAAKKIQAEAVRLISEFKD